MQNSSRIIVNTIAQYSRSVVNMILNLIATRVILDALGMSDYGIYSLISGVVAFLSFINNALAVTTQRYLSISQGHNNLDETRDVFKNSLYLHLFVAIILLIGLELVFPLLFRGFLNIPSERLEASKLLYHIILGILCISVVSSPYKAAIIAHENIVFVSIVEVLDAVIKLVCACLLTVVNYDKLIAYGLFLLLIQIFNIAALAIFSILKYPECKSNKNFRVNFAYIKEFFSFAGWTFYSIGCVYGRSQGIAVVVNKFMGTIFNASYGLALQISGALNTLSQSLLNAVNPQLMRSEGQGDRSRMLRLAEIESKIALLVFVAVTVPALFEMPRLLELWLKEVPESAVFFCRMVIIASIFDMITVGLGSANQAVGDIRKYTLVIYTIKILTVPFAFICLKIINRIELLGVVYVILEIVSTIYRLPIVKNSAGLNVGTFIKNVVVRSLIPIIALVTSCWLVVCLLEMPFRFLITFSIPVILFVILVYILALSSNERMIIKNILHRVFPAMNRKISKKE
jgi:O-antigen/teichoic acid export membrane protein